MPPLTFRAPRVSEVLRVGRNPSWGSVPLRGRGCLGITEATEGQLGSRWWQGMSWTSLKKVPLKEEAELELGHGNPACWFQGPEVWRTEQPFLQREGEGVREQPPRRERPD